MRLSLIQENRGLLGSKVTIQVAAFDVERAEQAVARAFEECERIERLYSRFIAGNELARVNASVGEWVEVDEELYELIHFGERLRERTEGAFDLTVKSILEGWGYGPGYSLQEGASGACGTVELGERTALGGGRVRLSAEIDLGGLGKGYALDRMLAALDSFANVCVDAGGDIVARGKNADGEPWKVVFEHPTDLTKGIGQVEVDGLAVACSSPARRRWRDRHHLVQPRAGQPAQEMLAVYTQAPAGLLADAYATALFALGFERAQKCLSDLPVEAMLVGPNGRLWRSAGFKGELFTPSN